MRRAGRADLLRTSLLALSLGAACSSERPSAVARRFPIGIYGVSDASSLSRLKEGGFDALVPESRDPAALEALAAQARRHGMSLLADPRGLLAREPRRTARWPVLAWHLEDEPDVNGVSPETLAGLSGRIREWDPGRAQTFVVGKGRSARPYAGIGDAVMLDWYPVPHLPIDSVMDEVKAAIGALPRGKPLWFVAQAFDWRDVPQRDPGRPRIGRFPTSREIRFMAYAAVVAGAGGIFFFKLDRPDGSTLLDFPELWQAVTRTSRELKSLQPILERGRPAHLPFPPDPDGLQAVARHYLGRVYLILVNRKKTAYQRVPDHLLLPEWRPLFEYRRQPKELLKAIGRGWYLKPFQVLVLESGLRRAPTRTW